MPTPLTLPMFPLGTVLFPGQPLSLHVFEPRYLVMVSTCLEAAPEFGVVLIDRGSEVGGRDTRSGVGTVARISDVAELPPGPGSADRRLLLLASGTRRFRVERWLPDDPHPWAEVVDWPDDDGLDGSDGGDRRAEIVAAVAGRLRRVLAMQSELGETVADATFDLASDPTAASHQLSALAPVTAFDRQRLLAADSVDERLDRLSHLLDDCAEVSRMRLGSG